MLKGRIHLTVRNFGGKAIQRPEVPDIKVGRVVNQHIGVYCQVVSVQEPDSHTQHDAYLVHGLLGSLLRFRGLVHRSVVPDLQPVHIPAGFVLRHLQALNLVVTDLQEQRPQQDLQSAIHHRQ